MNLNDDWEFNVLGIYNYRRPGKLKYFFDFIAENHCSLEGDIAEAGTFNGRSILSIALFLKEIGSDKQVYGYDSFTGFPLVFHHKDEFAVFDELLAENEITPEHHRAVQRLHAFKAFLKEGAELTPRNISTSRDFSGCSIDQLLRKIVYLGLDNIRLVPGAFSETMSGESDQPRTLMACLVDCDLYSSYTACLPFFWSRLIRGGYMFLDEYFSLKFPGGRVACNEFFAGKGDKPFRHSLIPGDFERWGVQKIHE